MNDFTAEDVLLALDHILADSVFNTSPQMSAFLRYVVEEKLAGRAKNIKAYSVAVDALGKPGTFDPQNDPCVRVLAWRLRHCIDTYYSHNHDYAVRIILTPGSYVPQFHASATSEQSLLDDMNKRQAV